LENTRPPEGHRVRGWRDGGMAGWRDGKMAGWRDGGMVGWRDRGIVGWLSGESTGLAILRTWVENHVPMGGYCEYELLTFLLAHTALTSLRFRRPRIAKWPSRISGYNSSHI